MHRLTLALRSAFVLTTAGFSAWSQSSPPPMASPAYRLPPAAPPLPPAPAPAREPEEIPRHVVEIGAVGTLGSLGCAGSAPTQATTPDPCASLGPAIGGDLHGLWRPTSHLAFGGWGGYTGFSWDATKGTGQVASSGGVRWWTLGLEARAYLFGEGAFDPFVGFGLGGGFLTMSADVGAQKVQLNRNGLVSVASLGANWWVTSLLKLGPQVDFLWQPAGGTELCSSGTCLDASNAIARIPNRVLRLGLGVSFGVGDEL